MPWLYIILGFIPLIILLAISGSVMNKTNEEIEAEYNEHFTPTEIVREKYGVKRYVEVDMSNKRWRINRGTERTQIYEFEDLRDFELLEKSGGTYTKATTAPTVLGALLDVPNSTKTYVQAKEYTQMKIRISLKDLSIPDQYITFSNNEKGSQSYKETFENIEKCLSLLRKIKAYNEEQSKENEQSNDNTSVADELIKLKSLLDEGVISQEEFETQKSKLL